jgi:DNA-binding MarR family transcriptional regulator
VSHQAVKAVVKASLDPGRFSHAEFRVLVVLADHHNHNSGQCNPGYARLAAETHLARSYVVKLLKRLEERGELASDGSSKGGRGNRRNYTLALGKGRSGVTVSDPGKGR